MTSYQLTHNGLSGQWKRTDGILMMNIFAFGTAGEQGVVEFTMTRAEGSAVLTWDYVLTEAKGLFWLHFINRITGAVEIYRIDAFENHKKLRLHAAEVYDFWFNDVA